MKTKKLVLKKVVSASILLSSKFYSTNMTKLKVTSRVLYFCKVKKKVKKKYKVFDYTYNVHLY